MRCHCSTLHCQPDFNSIAILICVIADTLVQHLRQVPFQQKNFPIPLIQAARHLAVYYLGFIGVLGLPFIVWVASYFSWTPIQMSFTICNHFNIHFTTFFNFSSFLTLSLKKELWIKCFATKTVAHNLEINKSFAYVCLLSCNTDNVIICL